MHNDLPTRISYPLPATADLPQRSVPWTPDPARSALLVHDMQQHFLRPYTSGQEPAESLLGNIGRLLALARELSIPVYYTAQPAHQQPSDRALLNDFWGAGIGSNEAGARIVDELQPHPHDTVLTKWRYSAFQRTNLAETLHASGRDQLIITGVYAHIGCQVSAADAFMHDIQPFMVADAVGDFTAAHHAQALAWVAARCGVVTDTESLTTAWAGEPDPSGTVSTAGTAGTVSDHIRGRVAELLFMDAAEVGVHDDLLELGLDSIRVMDLAETLRADGLEASFETLAASSTVHEWAAALQLQGAGA